MKGRGRRKRRISEHNRATYERLSTSLVRQTMKAWAKLGDTQTQNAQIQLACQLCCGSICSYFLLPWVLHYTHAYTWMHFPCPLRLYFLPPTSLKFHCIGFQTRAFSILVRHACKSSRLRSLFQTSSWSFALTGSRPVRLKLSCLHR